MACTESFTLDPAASGTTLTVTFTAEELPYLQQWFNANKQADETPEHFIRRQFLEAALRWRADKLKVECRDQQQLNAHQLMEDMRTYQSTVDDDALTVWNSFSL